MFRLFAGLLSKDFAGALSQDDDDDDSDIGAAQTAATTTTTPKKLSLDESLQLLLGQLSGNERQILQSISDQIEFQRSQIEFYQSAARNAAVEVEECEREKRRAVAAASGAGEASKLDKRSMLALPATVTTSTRGGALKTDVKTGFDDNNNNNSNAPPVPPEEPNVMAPPPIPEDI